MRTKLLFGNWKMNKTRAEALAFASSSQELLSLAKEVGINIGVAPTFTSLSSVVDNAPGLWVAAQNCHFADHGAFTGEISIPMIKDLGIDTVIIGHSERRTYFAETNETCQKKIDALLTSDMIPLYCVGETLAQFEEGITKDIIKEQVEVGLANVEKEKAHKIIIAYEPVWSIGTGKNASKEIAQDICHYIRELLRAKFGDVADEILILYGGSVKPENVHAYLLEKDVDGALIGGASLSVESFRELIKNAANQRYFYGINESRATTEASRKSD